MLISLQELAQENLNNDWIYFLQRKLQYLYKKSFVCLQKLILNHGDPIDQALWIHQLKHQ